MKCSKCDGTLVKIEEGLAQCTECGSKYRLRKPQAAEQKPVPRTATTMTSRPLKPKGKPVGLLTALIAAILLCACGILFWLFMRDPLSADNAAKVLKKTGYTEMSADEILDILESRVDSTEAYTYISAEADIKRFIDYSAPNATIPSISYIKDMTVGNTGDANYCLASYFLDFPSEDNAKDYVSDWISQSRPETILQAAAQYTFTEESYSAIKDSIHAVEGEKDKTSFYIIDVNIYGLQSTFCIYQRGKHVCTFTAVDYNSTKGQRRLDDFCKEFDLVSPSEAKTIGTEVQLSMDSAISEGSSSETDKMTTGATEATNLSGQMEESKYTIYDNLMVTGNQIVSLIKQFEGDQISIIVDTDNNADDIADGKQYIYAMIGFDYNGRKGTLGEERAVADADQYNQDLAAMQNKADPEGRYISPGRIFLCHVLRDENTDAVTALAFNGQ